jgi:RND family efflux transporter MFP subunit
MINDNIQLTEVVTKPRAIAAGTAISVMFAASAIYYFNWFPTTQAAIAVPSGPPPAAVAVAQARSMTMAPHTVLPGTVVSLRDSVIASETSGKILNIANIGDVILKGEVIAEIDSSDAQQLVDQRRADLQRLQSLLSYHNNYYERVGVEDNKLGVSEIGIAELRSNRDTAKADVASAAATLKSAQNDLQRTSIRAPFNGRVVSQSIQMGEYAQVGGAIARLVDIENLEVSARVPATMVQPIKAETLLQITGMGKSFSAPMRALVPVGDAISRTMELRVRLTDSGLLVGSPVRVSLPSAPAREVVAVPRDAVVLRSDAQYVFAIDDEGKAKRSEVQLGYAQDDMIEVIGDIAADATVVVRGGERLRDGQAVKWPEQEQLSAVSAVSSSVVN